MEESKETKTNLVFQTYHVYLDLFSVLDKVYKKNGNQSHYARVIYSLGNYITEFYMLVYYILCTITYL